MMFPRDASWRSFEGRTFWMSPTGIEQRREPERVTFGLPARRVAWPGESHTCGSEGYFVQRLPFIRVQWSLTMVLLPFIFTLTTGRARPRACHAPTQYHDTDACSDPRPQTRPIPLRIWLLSRRWGQKQVRPRSAQLRLQIL